MLNQSAPHPQTQSECTSEIALRKQYGLPGRREARLLDAIHCLARPIHYARWYGSVLLEVGRNALAHIRVLLAKNELRVSLGSSYERAPTGYLFPHRRTHARISGIENLLAKYPWAGLVEETIFLEGFDKGEEFARHPTDIPTEEEIDPRTILPRSFHA